MGILIKKTKQLNPPPDLSPSEWAERYRYLSPEDSAEPGKFRLSRAPYQRGILDALHSHRRVVLMCSAQIGKTLCQTNALGFWIDHSPAPILWVAPTIEMAEATSKEKIQPMIRDTPKIKGLVEPTQSRKSGNTILQKKFPGGQLTLAGANSPASLASRSIRYLLLDEIDRYPVSAGQEGDPLKLAEKRTAAFWNSVVFAVSTPTIKEQSRIEKEFYLSDQRHYYCPCPHCGHFQWLRWDNLRYEGKNTDDFKLGDGDWLGYICEKCDVLIEESYKTQMLRLGEWRPHQNSRIAGFHINELCSPFRSWRDMAWDFEEAKNDPQTFQVWWNTSLGLPFEEDTQVRYDWENLLVRAESSRYVSGKIPEGVLYVTAGVDVQEDRLEVGIFGWGEGEQAWLIGHYKLYGETLQSKVWEDLESLMEVVYDHPLGGEIRISKVGIDTGFQSQDCYVEIRRRKNWLALKGFAGDRPIISTPKPIDINWRGKTIKRGIKLHIVGVDQAKHTLLGRCKLNVPGAKYINVPKDLDQDWAKGFAGSEVRVKKHRGGRVYYQWEKLPKARNEPLDCFVYAYAVASFVGLGRMNWQKLKKQLTVSTIEPVAPPAPEPEPPPSKRPRFPKTGPGQNWAKNW